MFKLLVQAVPVYACGSDPGSMRKTRKRSLPKMKYFWWWTDRMNMDGYIWWKLEAPINPMRIGWAAAELSFADHHTYTRLDDQKN